MSSRIPALGPRGEGWVIAQLVLFAIIGGAGLRAVVDAGVPGPWGRLAMLVGLLAISGGGLLAARGSWDLRASFSPFPRPVVGAPLIETGAYGLVRHPIYSGLILGALGWALVTSSFVALVSAGLLLLLFAAKGRREEAWLAAIHPDYGAYQRRTKRLIPWIY
jgi:protein-S-isoprenylcysteine O-methyltransferase Ste14